jgi:hypothetical protein
MLGAMSSDFSWLAAGKLTERKRIAFLVGGPRSGTTWLQLLLSRSSRIATTNETHLFTSYTPSLFAGWRLHQLNSRSIGLHHLMEEDEYFSAVRAFVTAVMSKILEKNPHADIILEKTPDHVLHWNEILKLFPDALFIHLVRDPRSVVASLSAAGTDWARQWTSRNVLSNCETWKKYIQEGKKLKRATDNYREVRYEDLWQRGEDTLMEIFSWLGVEVSADDCSRFVDDCQIINLRNNCLERAPWDLSAEPREFYRKGGIDNWKTELTPREVYLIEHLTRDLMAEFGFVAEAKPRIILPLIIRNRLQFAFGWRLQMRREKRMKRLSAMI